MFYFSLDASTENMCVCVCVYKQKVSFQSRGIDVHLLNEKFSVGSQAAIKRLAR